jgi:hypothetical protein
MSPSSIYDQITREHPAYVAGFAQGRDVGIVIAMHAITCERVHQQRLSEGERDQGRYVYADGALPHVAKVLARRFWQ